MVLFSWLFFIPTFFVPTVVWNVPHNHVRHDIVSGRVFHVKTNVLLTVLFHWRVFRTLFHYALSCEYISWSRTYDIISGGQNCTWKIIFWTLFHYENMSTNVIHYWNVLYVLCQYHLNHDVILHNSANFVTPFNLVCITIDSIGTT
jgi:hypothetical protein